MRNINKIIEHSIKCDQRLSKKLLHCFGDIENYARQLIQGLSVEIGFRQSCGHTDVTVYIYREWIKIVKLFRREGFEIIEEKIKHKNGWASNNSGFWNSSIYTLKIK